MGRYGLRGWAGRTAILAVTASLAVAPAAPVRAATTITLSPVSTGFPNPIGLDYYQPTNQLLMSVNWSSGLPYNFALVAADGSQSQFSAISGLSEEVYLSAIRPSACPGGFVPGDVYVGTGTPGVVARVTDGGNTLINPWVTLPGETGLLRGGLFQDRFCAAGGDLVVTTTDGNVWRITSGGSATQVAAGVGDWLEGPTTVPWDARYGPWAGQILAASEGCGCIRSIDPTTGSHATWSVGMLNMVGSGVASAEGVHIVPRNQNFYGVDFGSGSVVGADWTQFDDVVGDVVVATEFPGRLVDLTWDAAAGAFSSHDLLGTNAGQFEGTTFAPVGVPPIPPAPPPIPPSVMQVTALPVAGSVGYELALPVATFTDTDLGAVPAYFSATVTWGDGHDSAATVLPTANNSPVTCAATSQPSRCFLVYARHTYAAVGTYSVGITVTKVNGQTAGARGSATITRSTPASFRTSAFGWEVTGAVSAERGLMISDALLNETRLGRRDMAEDMSVAYLKVSLASSPALRRVSLSPNAVELGADGSFMASSRLLSGPTVVPIPGASGQPGVLYILARYRIDFSPNPSATTSWLEVLQTYEFHQEMADNATRFLACEPSAAAPVHLNPLNCARWKPVVSFVFHAGTADRLLSINVVERLHFLPDSKPVRATTLGFDCEGGIAPKDPCDAIPFLNVLALYNRENPIQNEAVVSAIRQNTMGDYENLHLTWEDHVGLPAPPPGCPLCVHMHWGWGAGVSGNNPLFGQGRPLVLWPTFAAPAPNPLTNQSLDVALVTNHPGQEAPQDFRDLIQGLPGAGYGGGSEALADPVVFLSATATNETVDSFFAFGGFFGSEI